MNRKSFVRSDRVGLEIKRVLSDLVLRNIGDPRLKNVTITVVKMSKDLRVAKVYFTVYRGIGDTNKATDGFLSAKGYVKRELARRMNLRYMPEIVFFHDESFDYGDRMNKVFNTIIDSSR